ncbi:zinc finger BED domain-containing protein 5-like [Sipha flava]|uniref:Zinc finger BED domain-containing protein 5-like n=1 Tax=Sipha flava TaxID=143950 RepID=A0A8B8FX42_9HEMI|nr:zinc finger BED domain-containing protein 5-like [Sipha flava]
MERWFKTGSIRPENRKPTTVDQSKEDINCCSKNVLESTIPDVENLKGNKKRKYDDSYLDMGFTEFSDGRPQCVICNKVLPNSSMFPAKLRRHFETHPDFTNKTADYFKRKSDELHATQKTFISHVKTHSEKSLKASYLVSHELALAGKPHTLAETLIKPLLVKVVKCMADEKTATMISNIPLSNNTVRSRIQDLSHEVKDTIISRIGQTKFSLQLDESTDVAGLAVMMTFVRYEFSGIFHEDILFCKPLPSSTSGSEIFSMLDAFFIENSIPWNNCIDVCTDGAKAMVGNVAGVVARIKKVSPNCTSSHCVLHRHSLATKKMPVLLKQVLDNAVKIINHVKTRPLQCRLQKILCEDMGALFKSLLLHTEVRWLSRGKALSRLLELRTEVFSILKDNNSLLTDYLNDQEWLCKLCYLADIFSKMNEFSTSIQGKQKTIFDANDKIFALKKKIAFYIESVDNKDLTLTSKPAALNAAEYEVLIDMVSDSYYQTSFKSKPISEFWAQLGKDHSILSSKAKLLLLPFGTTYLCETAFSRYTATKTKYRSRLDAEDDMCLQLTSVIPDIDKLSSKKQAHCSH